MKYQGKITDPKDLVTKEYVDAGLSGKLGTSGDGSNVTAAFTAAPSRTNISTGEKLSVIFGKIAKWFADLGAAAFRGVDSTVTASSTNLAESGAVKSALTQVETDIASIHATGTTNTTGAEIPFKTYFYLNNVLVRAKTDIAVNAAFTSGTNYETVTAGGLNDLLKVEDILSEITFNIGGARSAVRSGNIITINFRTGPSSLATDTVLFTVPTKYIPCILRNNLITNDDTMYFSFASFNNTVSSCQIAAKTNGEFKVVGKAAPPYSGGNIVYMI